MANKDIALMAHLMRRAGFGSSRDELEERVAKGYEATVEELLDPDAFNIPEVDTDVLYRCYPIVEIAEAPTNGRCNVIYHMINSKRLLEEKMTLFWHQLFPAGNSKIDNPTEMVRQIDMFREQGLGNYRDLLVDLAKDPAMIYWLDNNENHKDAPNENWGRELLELFSMGQGNYTEQDVYECSRAFTGDRLADINLPGVQSMVGRIKAQGTITATKFVDSCLDLIGPLEVIETTRQELVTLAEHQGGDLRWDTDEVSSNSARRVGDMLALIAASREYQFN